VDYRELVCDSSAVREPRAVPTVFYFRFAHVDDDIRLRFDPRLHSSASRDSTSSTDWLRNHTMRSSFDLRETKAVKCLTRRYSTTTPAVTCRACARPAPAGVVADLGRSPKVMSPALEQILNKIRDAELPSFAGIEFTGPNVRDRAFGDTPLHVVAIWGDVDAAKILIEAGATIDVPGEHGCTALHEAAMQGHAEVVKLLLSKGADRKIKSNFGSFDDIASTSDDPTIKQLAIP